MKELFTALCAAQAEMPIVDKNKSGRFKYADLPNVVHMTRPILTKHGLSIIQTFEEVQGRNILITILGHNSGESISSRFVLPLRSGEQLDKGTTINNAQGGDITFYRRYAYCAIIGCAVSDEDFDGDAVEYKNDEFISEKQYALLKNELRSCPDKEQKILAGYKIESLTQLPKSEMDKMLKWIKG